MSRHSWYSIQYCTVLLLLLILGQEHIMGASALPRGSNDWGAHGDTNSRELVGEDSPYCRYRRRILSCDFNWIDKDVEVPIRPNCSESIERIFVRHVHNLLLNRGSCCHLSLIHVTSMKLVGEEVDDCLRQNFRLQNTTAPTLPVSVGNLYVHESHITNITLNTIFEQLTIIGSTIGELNLNSTINSTITVKLHSTTIDVISKFRLSKPASLFMQNCTVKNIFDRALILGSDQNVLNQLRLGNSHSGAVPVITLENGGDMTMGNIEGKLQIKSKREDEYDNQLELNEINTEMFQSLNEQCDTLFQSNIILIIMIILVVFLSISIILNVTLLFYDQPRTLINKLLSKSDNNEKIVRKISDSHRISDKHESYESELLINGISPTKTHLPENNNAPNIIIQTSDNKTTRNTQKINMSLSFIENKNEITPKEKLSPIKEQIMSLPRRRYKSESATNVPVTFLDVHTVAKRLSSHSNSSFVGD